MRSLLDSLLSYLHGDNLTVLPQMELVLFALGILMFDFLLKEKEKPWNAYMALAGVAAASYGLFVQAMRFNKTLHSPLAPPGLSGFENAIVTDGFSLLFGAIFLAATALVILLAARYLDIEREQQGEFYA